MKGKGSEERERLRGKATETQLVLSFLVLFVIAGFIVREGIGACSFQSICSLLVEDKGEGCLLIVERGSFEEDLKNFFDWLNHKEGIEFGESSTVCELRTKGLSNQVLFLLGEKMDLASATEKDLELLPGIGEKTAQRILEIIRTEGWKSFEEHGVSSKLNRRELKLIKSYFRFGEGD